MYNNSCRWGTNWLLWKLGLIGVVNRHVRVLHGLLCILHTRSILMAHWDLRISRVLKSTEYCY